MGEKTAPRGDSDPASALAARLDRSADAVGRLELALEDEREVRDQAVLEAVDAGMRLSEVARWGRVSKGRVNQIVAARALRLQEEREARAAAPAAP